MSLTPCALAQLPFKADALEPYLSTEQMTQHHDKHLRNYIDSLNKQITNQYLLLNPKP